MQQTTLIMPGYQGSGPDHWQSWLEAQLPGARRIKGIDWGAPVLARWAAEVRWGSRLVHIGRAGHINAESGFGPWPQGLELLRTLQQAQDDLPLGLIGEGAGTPRGRQGALARIRHRTRFDLVSRAKLP